MVVVLLCLLIGLSSCAEFENKEKINSDPSYIYSENLNDAINIEVQPTTQPERYIIYFGWPKIENAKRIRIRREQILAIVSPEQTTFSHEVEHNQTLTYTFDILDSTNKVERSFSKIVIVPRDFVVREGQHSFSEDQKLQVKRVFLSRETSLLTNGFNVEIVTEELISEKGRIETFFVNDQALNGTNGRSAGTLKITAKHAQGLMTIIMRGEHGGHGIKGTPYAQRAPDGLPPTNGQRICECRKCRTQDFLLSCSCATTGADGTDGANGAKGRTGGNGGSGGDTGTLKVEIEEGSAFVLKTESFVGLGGNAGEGGDGQLGGHAPSGNGGACSGNPGRTGLNGPHGDNGKKGRDGKHGQVCVYIASEGKNDCY